MRVFLIFLLPILIMSCRKSREGTTENHCHLEMKERFNNELQCTERGVLEVNLHSAIYEGKEIYFPMVVCPTCNTAPPQFGYTCEGEKKEIIDFNKNILSTKVVYNSCIKKFID